MRPARVQFDKGVFSFSHIKPLQNREHVSSIFSIFPPMGLHMVESNRKDMRGKGWKGERDRKKMVRKTWNSKIKEERHAKDKVVLRHMASPQCYIVRCLGCLTRYPVGFPSVHKWKELDVNSLWLDWVLLKRTASVELKWTVTGLVIAWQDVGDCQSQPALCVYVCVCACVCTFLQCGSMCICGSFFFFGEHLFLDWGSCW